LKNLVAILCFVLSGCGPTLYSTHSSEKNNLAIQIQYYGPRNDLNKAMSMKWRYSDTLPITSSETDWIPPNYAVQCDTRKLHCKHAVVQMVLHCKFSKHNGFLFLEGELESHMGRSISEKSRGSFYSMSVPNEVPIIGVETKKKAFTIKVIQGSHIEIAGIAQDKIVLTVIRPKL